MSLTLENRYDEAASWWGGAMAKLGYRTAYTDLARRALGDRFFATIADVGTGSGDLAAAVCDTRQPPDRLVLADSSSRMLDQATRALAGRAAVVDGHFGPLDAIPDRDAFDLVLAGHVIEHLTDPEAAVRRLADLVKPGGLMLLIVSRPHWCQWLIWLRWRHRWFAAGKVRRMIAGAGLEAPEILPLSHGPPSRTSLGYLVRKPPRSTGGH
ncbi:class I SAM-dependent methyltransferase [Bauldia sp.]|uniref:class I SAM-dependent methyltransferase n=1 Tax=Bauldia sp. TaxID=2575872 RepID=UPI003BAD63BA